MENKDQNKKTIIIASVVGVIILCICIVIAIILFAGSTLVAYNPAEDFKNARNTKRVSDINTIAVAITHYKDDNPDMIYLFDDIISCNYGSESITTDGFLNDILVDEYLIMIPTDPSAEISFPESGYAVCRDPETLQIIAPFAEDTPILTRVSLSTD